MKQNLRQNMKKHLVIIMSKSKGQERIRRLLGQIFNFPIKEEYYVKFENTRLYFDFFIPHLSLFIEVDGTQHNKKNDFFHSTNSDYFGQKLRDRKKEEYAALNQYYLLRLDYKTALTISKEGLMELIIEATEEV